MISPPVVPDLAAVRPVDAFERLFENEFITLERLAISRRVDEGMDYLDETTALARLLDGGRAAERGSSQADPEPDGPDRGPDDADRGPTQADRGPDDGDLHRLHAVIYRAWPDVNAVVVGWPIELRALLLEGLALPAATSMMIKRGVPDLATHIVDGDAILGPGQDAILERARARAEAAGMQHVLVVGGDGLVCAAGPTMHETMAHYSNVAFAARVECLRLEELRAARD